jgi:hypothetical protein
MKIRDLTMSNPGGVLTGHKPVTPPTLSPNAENGEGNEPEHQGIGVEKAHSVATHPDLMRAHQAGSITASDHTKLHKPVVAGSKLSKPDDKPAGEDGMSEMTKARPVVARIQQNAFGNVGIRAKTGNDLARGPAIWNG